MHNVFSYLFSCSPYKIWLLSPPWTFCKCYALPPICLSFPCSEGVPINDMVNRGIKKKIDKHDRLLHEADRKHPLITEKWTDGCYHPYNYISYVSVCLFVCPSPSRRKHWVLARCKLWEIYLYFLQFWRWEDPCDSRHIVTARRIHNSVWTNSVWVPQIWTYSLYQIYL